LTGALLCASAIVGTGCGPDPGVVGSVRVGGSNALLTFVQQSAAAFTSQHPLARVRVDLTGTDDGYSLLCDGIADAATATRPATPREERACAASDVRFVPMLVGRNAVVAFTARNSRVPGCLSTADLRALTGATPRPRTTWRGLGDASLPVVVVVPEAGSHARDVFESRVLADPAAGDPVALRADAVAATAGDRIVARVARTRGAIGITGFAALQPIPPGMRVIEVNGGAGCVEPSAASIASKAYPLTLPSGRPSVPDTTSAPVSRTHPARSSRGANPRARSSWTRMTSPTWHRVARGRLRPVDAPAPPEDEEDEGGRRGGKREAGDARPSAPPLLPLRAAPAAAARPLGRRSTDTMVRVAGSI
jgi:phosphate transport system substrate-binding protein